MDQFKESQEPKKPEMDAVDKEAHEMFMENAVETLREVLHIDDAIKLIEEQIKNGTLNPNMTIRDMIDILEEKKEKLIGEDDESEDNGDDADRNS